MDFITQGYPIELEVSGKAAAWRRPDTGDMPRSFPVPTMSAAKGILEQIAYLYRKEAVMWPYKVELCSPLRLEYYNYNCGGVGRKSTSSNAQIFAEILSNVCYRIYAVSWSPTGELGKAHFLQDLFLRRIRKGQCFTQPFLGWNQFWTSYFGPFRENTKVYPENAVLESMPLLLFNKHGKLSPCFTKAKLVNGVLDYSVKSVERSNGKLTVSWKGLNDYAQ